MASNGRGTPAGPEPIDRPRRVAIVGGGCAGLAAAWELAAQGIEVDVYERSWRLGGKGGSGRLDDGRIREHGLHLWLGFYDNAFGLMHQCYAEVAARGWGPGAAGSARLMHGSLLEAFFPEPHIGVGGASDRHGIGVWGGFFAPAPGLPGDPDPEAEPRTPASYLVRCLDLAKTLILSRLERGEKPGDGEDPDADPSVREQVERVARMVRGGTLTIASAFALGFDLLEQWLATVDPKRRRPRKVLELLKALAELARVQFADLAKLDPLTRAKSEVIDIVLAIAVGLYRDRVLLSARGFDAINHLDYRKWLSDNGAADAARHSRFLTGIYDFAFAYEHGTKAQLAAGVAVRCALRMFFTYRGSLFWRLRSGMGDTVFAPLYRVLAAGGQGRAAVRFHFMHELKSIGVASAPEGGLFATELVFERTGPADATEGVDALDAAGCWPETSRHLVGDSRATERVTRRLEAMDFEAVVLATGVDDLKDVFRDSNDLFEHLPARWRAMRDSAATVGTCSAQIWLDKSFAELGWGSRAKVVTALGAGFDTIADMSHTVASERAWRAAMPGSPHLDGVGSVAYLCSVLPDSRALQPDIEAEVESSLRRFIEADAARLFPEAGERGSGLAAHAMRTTAKANVVGSDRYSLSLPKTIDQRVSPLDTAFANLVVAGDWTACGLDAGCVEAAVISGRLASHALTGSPPLNRISGYDHP